MKGVYTDQPKLVCNSDVAVVVPQVPLVKLFTLQCGNKYTHPTRAVSLLKLRARELSLLPSANGVDLTYPTPLFIMHIIIIIWCLDSGLATPSRLSKP